MAQEIEYIRRQRPAQLMPAAPTHVTLGKCIAPAEALLQERQKCAQNGKAGKSDQDFSHVRTHPCAA